MDNNALYYGMNNYLHHPDGTLYCASIKPPNLFNRIENVAKEQPLLLPVTFGGESSYANNTLQLNYNLPNVYNATHQGLVAERNLTLKTPQTAPGNFNLPNDYNATHQGLVVERNLTFKTPQTAPGNSNMPDVYNAPQRSMISHRDPRLKSGRVIPRQGFLIPRSFHVMDNFTRQLNCQNEIDRNSELTKPAEVSQQQTSQNVVTHEVSYGNRIDRQPSEVPQKQTSQSLNRLNPKSGCVTQLLKEGKSNNQGLTLAKSEKSNDPKESSLLTSNQENRKIDSALKPNDGVDYNVVLAQKCKTCGFLAEGNDAMLQHIKLQHSEEPPANNGETQVKSITRNGQTDLIYLCGICKLGYASTDQLKLHMIMTHKLISSELEAMETDNQKTDDKNSTLSNAQKKQMRISLLKQQSKALRKIKCSVKGCEIRFALDEMRAKHEKCHVPYQKSFKCSGCTQKFSKWRMCSMHMWRCHKLDIDLLTCPMCNEYKTVSFVRLINHIAIHNEERPFKCQTCEKSFKQHSQMVNHQITHKDADKLPPWATRQQCEVCKQYFSNSKTLKKHVQSVHDKFKPFICVICGHKSTRKSMLKLHLRQHTGEKPYQCEICDYKTGDHNTLRRHVMRHTGLTKYACPHCNYQSIQSTPYKKHIRSKHPGSCGIYACLLCSYNTVNENAYIAHVADHKNGLLDEIATKITEIVTSQDTSNIQRQEEEDESHQYLLHLEHSNDAVDTGGITIPAGSEIP